MSTRRLGGVAALWLALAAALQAADANRLTYLDEADPFYVGVDFPKLTTPQWIGEPGVDAVVTLGIDDMKGNAPHYEQFLRPILDRLKRIDGRAPVSIMSNTLAPEDALARRWLEEGLSLEVHTLTHPCPILARGDFSAAADTFHGCVDLMNRVPGNRPVAFRTPCCDSLNTPSPRLFAEIFNRVSSAGNYLQLDSSVFNVTTAADNELPRDWVTDPDGRPKFKKYVPFPSFVVTVDNYPYPYVIGRLVWELPCMVPSDWEAQNLHGKNNPRTVEDWKAGLDVAVRKKGTFNFVYHPHGWIANTQMVECIDYAVEQHGARIKFLTFREVAERLTKNLLAGQRLRAANGEDNGVRVLDVNGDGFLDAVIGNEHLRQTRVWNPRSNQWQTSGFPFALIQVDEKGRHDAGARFGILQSGGGASVLVRNEDAAGLWKFDGRDWVRVEGGLAGLEIDGEPVRTAVHGRDEGVRLRDLDRDGVCELIVANARRQKVLAWSELEKRWRPSLVQWPKDAALVDEEGRDNGVRFADLDKDGDADLIFSNPTSYGVYLNSPGRGWDEKRRGNRSERAAEQIPLFVREGSARHNGVWFHSDHLWIQNEDTAALADLVDRRSFRELLNGSAPAPSQ